jgi:hypothetical protein
MKTIPDSSRNMIAEKSYSSPQWSRRQAGRRRLRWIGMLRDLSRHQQGARIPLRKATKKYMIVR